MRRRRTVLAAALVAMAGPVLAVPVSFGSSATLTGLTFKMVDLRPDDGIYAGGAFLLYPDTATTTAKLIGNNGWNSLTDSKTAPGSLVSTLGGPAASALASFALGGPITNLISMGSATPGNTFDAYEANTIYRLYAQINPYTALTLTGTYTLNAWAAQDDLASPMSRSLARVLFGGTYTSSARAYARPDYGSSFQQLSGTMSVTLYNDKATAGLVKTSFGAFASGGQVAPIPEPSTYALFAAGLAVVGAVARRRSGKPA